MSDLILFEDEKKQLIKQTIAKQLNPSQFQLFMGIASARGLDPVLGQIHASVHKDKMGNAVMTPIVGIDGFRLMAHRTREYLGRSEAEFIYKDNATFPDKVRIVVYRKVGNQKAEFTATAKWSEYLPGQQNKQFMWKKMPETMLEKCCEAKALRMAFPNDLGGLYLQEEMEQASDPIVRDVNESSNFLPETSAAKHDKLISSFMGIGVSQSDILRTYDLEAIEDLNSATVEELRGIYTQIASGEKVKADYFIEKLEVGE